LPLLLVIMLVTRILLTRIAPWWPYIHPIRCFV